MSIYERLRFLEDEMTRQLAKAVLLERSAAELSDSMSALRNELAALIRELNESGEKYAGIVDAKTLGEYILSLRPEKSSPTEDGGADDEMTPELLETIQNAEINAHLVTVPNFLFQSFFIELLEELSKETTGRANRITEKLLDFARDCLENHST